MKILTNSWVLAFFCFATLSHAPTAQAWGRHGHSLIGETAVYLATGEKGGEGFKSHAFDVGYYCNVPDFIWKRPATYETERSEHYMDVDVLDRLAERRPEIRSAVNLPRAEFDKQFPEFPTKAGRAWWRIRELTERLQGFTKELQAAAKAELTERHALQSKWLITAGVIGHYVGDLSMPLHVTENHDGQATGQKGVHAFFEETCVDDLFMHLQDTVYRKAKAAWPSFQKKNAKRSVQEMVEELSRSSLDNIKELLAIDKRSQRQKVQEACHRFEPMILRRLVASSLVLGEIYRRHMNWDFNNDRFYVYVGEPEYIRPGEITAK